MLRPEELEHLATAIAKALQQARSVSDSEHYDHHRWIVQQIEKDRERAAFWRAMQTHVAKAGAWSVLTALGYAVYVGFKQILARA